MSGPGALALTGVVLTFVAAVLGIAADGRRYSGNLRRRGWLAFALAAQCFIGAAWWEALR